MSMKQLPMDSSQARAMAAFQEEQMRQQLMEQQMQIEMYIQQQLMVQQHQYEQQLVQQQQQFLAQQQQQHHAAHFDANDVRGMMNRLKPGESFEVEMYQGFEVHHRKQQANTAQILVALILAVAVIVMVLQS